MLIHTRLIPDDEQIPEIGHGIGGSNPIGLAFPQTKLASPLHSLNREFDEHTWSFVSQTIELGNVWPKLSTNVVLQNLICTQPAFSASVAPSIAPSKADLSTIRVTSEIAPVWLSINLAVTATCSSAGGTLVSSAQAPINKAGISPNTICHRRDTELVPFVMFVMYIPFQGVYPSHSRSRPVGRESRQLPGYARRRTLSHASSGLSVEYIFRYTQASGSYCARALIWYCCRSLPGRTPFAMVIIRTEPDLGVDPMTTNPGARYLKLAVPIGDAGRRGRRCAGAGGGPKAVRVTAGSRRSRVRARE